MYVRAILNNEYMATVCPNMQVLIQDQRFQKVRDIYKDRGWNDFVLAVKLDNYREEEDLPADWFPETEEDFRGLTDRFNQPVDNSKNPAITEEYLNDLYRTMRTLYSSPKVLNRRIDLISNMFRSRVDNLVKESDYKLNRQQAIGKQANGNLNGFQSIMNDVFTMIEDLSTIEGQKKLFKKQNPNLSDDSFDSNKDFWQYRANEFAKMSEHKAALAALAAPKIGAIEGIAVTMDGMLFNFDEQLETVDFEDDTVNEIDTIDNGEAQKGERYVDFRTLSLLSTLSIEAKNLISSLRRRDVNGNYEHDDLGYTIPLDIKQTAVTLHKVLRYSEPETMMDDLKQSVSRYPNLRGLVEHLVSNPDDRGLIYCSFKKAKSDYYYGYREQDGSLEIHSSGNRAEGNMLSKEAGTNISLGSTVGNEFSIVDASGNLKESGDITTIGSLAKGKTTYKALRALGFQVSEDDLNNVLNSYPEDYKTSYIDFQGNTKENASVKEALEESISAICDKARGIRKIGEDLTGSHLYQYAQVYYNQIAELLSPLQKGNEEERIISGNKALSANISPNALHQLIDTISNVKKLSNEDYKNLLMTEFGRFEGMGLGFGSDVRLTGWLADATSDAWKPESFGVVDMTDSNRTDYANLTDVQHMINSYVMFVRGGKNRIDNMPENGSYYEVPIQADYDTAYNFIFAPRYTYPQLVEKLSEEIECEAQRIAAIKERIANDPSDPNAELTRAKISVYEKRGLQFQIFPEMNYNGFADRYSKANPVQAHSIVRQEVDSQLKNLLKNEILKVRNLGVFEEGNAKLLGANGRKVKGWNSANEFKQGTELEGITSELGDSVASWLLNSFYARQQVTKLMYGGLENFKNTSDFEKRNMYSHATRIPLYTEATYNGKKVGKREQRVIYLSDDEAKSAIYDRIVSIAEKLKDQGKITATQAERLKSAYKSITTTDGQGIRTLDSLRSIKIMANLWTDADEKAYSHISSGKYGPEDVEHFMVGVKPIYTGYETIPAQPGEYQKPIRVPVLHKYSEMVLLPEMLDGISMQNDAVPFKALNKINKKLGSKNEVDLFLFGSGVKIGGHSLINAFATNNNGERILRDSESISDFVAEKVKSGDFWVHTLPLKYYGIAAATHADVVDKNIAWASQAEKEAWANILPEDTVTVAGKEMKASDARELYNKIKEARTIDTFKELRELFYSNRKLASILKEELSSRPYQSRELMFTLQLLEGTGSSQAPLFDPSIQHDVVALLSSIIKKRLTKVPVKGANILQTSGFGLDMDASSFDEKDAIKESDKLEIKFDKDGNFKYVEAYIPIHDSRLMQFADENGNITPERLNRLIADKVIPEDILNFIAYRTPSDAEHSIIPCRIKGFISNSAGATIRLPKEIMPMTGHDYDGDKMRCHFKDFTVGWNEDKIHDDYVQFSDSEAVQAILADEGDTTLTPYEVFSRNAKSDINPNSAKYRQIKTIEYDYDKSPVQNVGKNSDYRALNNALVDLMFAQLTSPSGHLKMFIPGGNAETTVYARTMQIMRASRTDEGKYAIADALGRNNVDGQRIQSVIGNTEKLYNYLIKQKESFLADVASFVSSSDSPFSATHATESHAYMMDGAGMIGVYAVYNSAAAMFQRLNLNYIPSVDSEGKPINVSFFGNQIGRLFPVLSNGSFTTLGLARLINAAVDNGKNPVLGHLNQTSQLAPITNFLFASGLSEEEVHLILNQPALIELGNRMKNPKAPALSSSISDLVNELKKDLPKDMKFSQAKSVNKVSDMSKSDYIKNLNKSYRDILNGTQVDKENQIYILQALQHICPAAYDLDQFTKLTRPESNSGGIDSSLGGTVAKIIQLDNFREKINNGQVYISGMEDVIGYRRVYPNSQTPKMISETIGNELPEVVAMNALMKDALPRLLREYFPQTKESWMRIEKMIANQYSYERIPGKIVERIQSDMVLWKLLSDSRFVTENPQEEQKRILENVPEQLRQLKERIVNASNRPGKDSLADSLQDNIFINNLELGTTLNGDKKTVRRIRFKLNGPQVEDTADAIRAGWDQLWRNEETKQLAEDLFKYNLYTNGFSYGRYEFAHYAPFSVVHGIKGYWDSINDIRNAGWDEDDEMQFYHQYCMNHWGDKNFLVSFKEEELPMNIRTSIGLETPSNAAMNSVAFGNAVDGLDYIVVKTRKEDKLYRILRDRKGLVLGLEQAQKLGIRNRNSQVMVQYNPKVRDFREVRPVFASNDVAWETKRQRPTNDEETRRMEAIDDIPFAIPISSNSLKQNQITAVSSDGKISLEDAVALGFEDEEFENDSTTLFANKINEAISSGKWSEELLDELADLNIIKYERLFEKLSGRERSELKGYLAAAKAVLNSSRYDSANARTQAEQAESNRENESRLINWAKAEEIYFDSISELDRSFTRTDFGGSESIIYIDEEKKRLVKAIDASHYNGNINGLIEKIILHNSLFNTGYELVGFVGEKDDFRVIVSQKFVKGTQPSIDEINSWAENVANLHKEGGWWYTNDNRIRIMDLNPDNIIKGEDGNLYVIDADVEYNPKYINNEDSKLYSLSTPQGVANKRKEKAYRELNKKLREILREHGVDVGVLDKAEEMLNVAGVTDFDTARVFGEGLKELIRISNGIEGEFALPEEFAHVAIEMLGHDNPLVSRLLNALRNDTSAMEEAYDGMLDEYNEKYNGDQEKLVLEAAGKLVAKHLFLHQEIESKGIRGLVLRICEAIKNLFKKFSLRQIDEAILDADQVASQLARDLLSGRLADEMSLEKITRSDKFYAAEKDLSDKQDLLSKMMKITAKRVDILQRRVKYTLGKGASSASLEETKRQLEKLEKAQENQKLETTVVDYLKDALSFMKEMEQSLDATINNRPANAVCKKLRIVKDTMFSFAQVIDDVKTALNSGELKDDINVKETIKDVSYEMEMFWKKYHNISLMYFEQFLSNIYGKDGVTVNVGRQKGRHISIHEMATKGDKDISTLSRLLNAVSDIDDYVLQAIDATTRDAKLNARAKVRELRPKLESALAAVVAEQGNRDQSWMFERKNVNGHLVRTGKYISQKEAEKLTDAQRNFYNVFMELKRTADSCLPESMIGELKMIMFRKEHYEKMKEAQGLNGALNEEWEAAKRSVLEMGDIDFENEEVIVDFEDNKVDQLPIKFLNKGKNESYDDMTEDAATSLMAYLGMALEYKEMNNVIGVLENARYMSSLRDIEQRKGMRLRSERIGKEDQIHYTKPFTVKQARTNIQKCIDDFYQMHVYGHLRKDEGTIGKTRISKRKTVDTMNRLSSLSQMALNLHQRIANVNTGFTQIVVESVGGKIKVKDVIWASSIWTAQSADRLAETGKTDYSNKLSLWMDKFDIHQDNGREASQTKYGRSRTSRVFNEGLLYAGLSIGEDFLAGTTALALARNYKMKGPNGEDSNIWDAYEVKYADEKNKTGAYLSLKKGYTKADGSELTFEDEKKFAKEVIGTNFELQGIYNTDDRSAIQQHSLGALAIMYRKWIAPAIKRRYAGVRYSNLKGDFSEGYYRTATRMIGDTIADWFAPVSEENSEKTILQILTDIKALRSSIALNWDKLTEYEKGNVTKSMTEMAIVLALFTASALLTKLPPDDHDDNKFLCWLDDLAVTQLLRLRSEIGSQAPTPSLINEGLRIMNSPFAAMRPLKDSLNVFQLMWAPNYFDVVKSGHYQGKTKAYKYFRSLPIISMFRKFDNFFDPSPLLEYYKTQNY